MNNNDLEWLKDLYENYTMPGRVRSSGALHCDHWSKLLYLHLKSKQHKEILINNIHSVLSLDGMYIDLELNAFIVDFGWKSRSIDSTDVILPIHPAFSVLTDQIFDYYSKPATAAYNLWHNKVF